MNKLRNIFILILSLVASGYWQVADAQVVPEPVQYTVSPETPGPNQQVNLEAQGVGGFLGNATITWTKDGKVAKSGVGESQFSFVTNSLGKQTVVRVAINSPTQGNFSQQFVFNPSLINLVWEADTTVPPFYKGKALYSQGSPLKIVAFPIVYAGQSRVDASALTYKWSIGDEPAVAQSGLGRGTFSFVGNQLKVAENVSVDVYYGNALAGHGEVTIPAVDPQLVLYERDALRGVLYDTAFPQSISLLGQEITLQAQPFYFSRPDASNGSLTYTWEFNGQDTTGPDTSSGVLTLRQTGAGSGAASINVSLQNYGVNAFVQEAQTGLKLLFGQSSGTTNAFGI